MVLESEYPYEKKKVRLNPVLTSHTDFNLILKMLKGTEH